MDYYQGVVTEYLRTDRAVFVNTEYCIQLREGRDLDKGGHWYCDALAADFGSRTVFLCEVTYSLQLAALVKRLKTWNDNWDVIRGALARDSSLPTLARDGFPKVWNVRPWLFVPEQRILLLLKSLGQMGNFTPRITPLEMVLPWSYCSDRQSGEVPCCPRHDRTKPAIIPEAMAK